MRTLAAHLIGTTWGSISMNKRIGAAVAAFGLTTAMAGVAIPAANARRHPHCP